MSFHPGELAVQERAGVLDDARRVGQMLRSRIRPEVHRFWAERRFVIVAGRSLAGTGVWVTLLAGQPGFIRVSQDGSQLDVSTGPSPEDPFAPAVAHENALGLLGIDFATRRRNRVNGIVRSVGAGIPLDVTEAFGNCPKYIHAYQPLPDGPVSGAPPRSSSELDANQRRWIENAGTFFLGTLHPESGADASHRGGAPGFVRVTGPRTLVWGDYSGNRLFQSLGNVAVHPPAGLLFLDVESGSTLQLTGTLQIDWSGPAAEAIPGAERVLRFSIGRVVERTGAIPLRWARGEPSPFNPPAR